MPASRTPADNPYGNFAFCESKEDNLSITLFLCETLRSLRLCG